MRIVVFGWGNDARGDDALGPLLLRRIAALRAPDVETIEEYQLQIENALDLRDVDAALFIDASRDAIAPFSFEEISSRLERTPTTHALSPAAVLDVFARISGRAPPPAFMLGLSGEQFALGAGLSATGRAALAAAGLFCDDLMATRDLAHWRRRSDEAKQRVLTASSLGSGFEQASG